MLRATLSLVLISLWCSAVAAETPVAAYKKLQLTDKFSLRRRVLRRLQS